MNKRVLKKLIMKHELPVVACSFGRDSIVVLHMVKTICDELGKDFRVIWNDTGVEYPEQYKFNKWLIKEWDLEKHMEYAKSKEWTFWRILDTYGMPIAPRDSRDREMQQATQSCCYHLKKKPTKEKLKEFKGRDILYITGLNAYESMNRKASAKIYGEYFYSKSWKHQKCHPILWWQDSNIDAYIRKHNLHLCDIYSYTDIIGYKVRNGCWCCPQAWKFGKGKWLKNYYPSLYKFLITKTELGEYIMKRKLGFDENQISLFDNSIQEKVIHTFDVRPCFFEEM